MYLNALSVYQRCCALSRIYAREYDALGQPLLEKGRRSGSCFDVHSSMVHYCIRLLPTRSRTVPARNCDASKIECNESRRGCGVKRLSFVLAQVSRFQLSKQAPSPGETQRKETEKKY